MADDRMIDTSFAKTATYIKNLLVYKPPDTPKAFVLDVDGVQEAPPSKKLSEAQAELDALLRMAHRVETALDQTRTILTEDPNQDKLKAVQKEIQSLEKQKQQLSPVELGYTAGQRDSEQSVNASLDENIRLINQLFITDSNADIVVRQLFIPMKPALEAALVFSKTMIDKKEINSTVLTPLFSAKNIDSLTGDVLQILTTQVLPINQVRTVQDFAAIIQGINSGDTVLFVDGSAGAIVIETKGFEHRGVSLPRVEQSVRGSQVAFTETLLSNISLLRQSLRSPDLVADITVVGSRSQTECAVLYVKSIANPRLVAEVKRRIANISTDMLSPGMLESFIEDHPNLLFPQVLSTERPDRVSSHLAEGRIAILVDGDPFAMVVPVSLFTLFQTSEDFALKTPWGTFMRIIRYIAALLTILLPSMYLAIIYFHPEALPTDLLLAISGARERVPIPSFVEVLAMELSFEFIREAGTRKPGLLGETIGIVGGIILGQAIVAANLISPITVVIIAMTGVGSFSIPDYQTGLAVRQVRFVFLLAAISCGLVGVSCCLFLLTALLCYMKSFGVPYLSPIVPKYAPGMDVVVRGPVYRQEMRPEELGTLNPRRQPSISRKWKNSKPEGGN